MSLSEVCIKRPVFSWVMTFIIILLGAVGYSRLSLLHKPAVDVPYVTIESHLNGAAPEVVEAQVTRPIEEAISVLKGFNILNPQAQQKHQRFPSNFYQHVALMMPLVTCGIVWLKSRINFPMKWKLPH